MATLETRETPKYAFLRVGLSPTRKWKWKVKHVKFVSSDLEGGLEAVMATVRELEQIVHGEIQGQTIYPNYSRLFYIKVPFEDKDNFSNIFSNAVTIAKVYINGNGKPGKVKYSQ